jgi:WD40 repeat protein
LLGTFFGHLDEVVSLKLLQNGRYLASSSKDKSIKIWRIENNFETQVNLELLCSRNVEESENYALSLDELKNGTLVGGYSGGTVRFWNPNTCELITTLDTVYRIS